ncbi:MAG TPA: class I SAM-dependent methyltransferase [Streptosporangiaceae bacterium]|nr:class I SAM-dependent methyltransferase [Streptosporangiaceae bacterium]
MPDAVARFAGFAAEYDAARPQPPAELTTVLMQWSGTTAPDVVDVGAGTGLSAAIWAGRARRVTAVEPGAGMRTIALARLGLTQDPADAQAEDDPAEPVDAAVPAAGVPTRFAVVAGTAEETGLPAACADIVTASQAMHWFDTARALPEIARILRPGGVFAAYDCDWPPCIDWETDAAYVAFNDRARELELAGGLRPPHGGKRHRETMADSGLFRFAAEIALLSQEQGDAARLVDVALSQGGTKALLEAGATEDEIGLTALREVAARTLPATRPWWWTYRVRMGVR